jgi:hypothetical protein
MAFQRCRAPDCHRLPCCWGDLAESPRSSESNHHFRIRDVSHSPSRFCATAEKPINSAPNVDPAGGSDASCKVFRQPDGGNGSPSRNRLERIYRKLDPAPSTRLRQHGAEAVRNAKAEQAATWPAIFGRYEGINHTWRADRAGGKDTSSLVAGAGSAAAFFFLIGFWGTVPHERNGLAGLWLRGLPAGRRMPVRHQILLRTWSAARVVLLG